MSTNELNTIARDLKELRLMAEQLDAEIRTLEDAIKAHMTEHAVDTLITTDVKITWRTVTSSRIDTTALKKQLPDVAAIVTKETTAVFAGLNTADGYTVDVTAAGMSVSQRTEVGENSVTVSNFQADTTDPTKLALSWDAQIPAGGWTLHYSIDGGESFKTVTAEANAATITPLLPDTEYIFNLEAASGVDVLTLPLSWKAPEAVDFSGYGVTPENIQVQLCKSTDAAAWETEIPEDASFSSRFAAGEKISMVIRLPQGAGTSDDSMQILYVIRDQDGKIVSYASDAGTWATMWNETFGVFDIMQLPETAGGYRVSLYFNGLFITDETFSIVE